MNGCKLFSTSQEERNNSDKMTAPIMAGTIAIPAICGPHVPIVLDQSMPQLARLRYQRYNRVSHQRLRLRLIR